MPRYKFSWDSLPSGLLRGLKRDCGLEGDVPAALRKAFGARPSEDFIQVAWPTLLEVWLKSDRPSRVAVVEQLRDRRLGNLTVGTKNASDQMEYLRSCRNGATLRAVVLEALLLVGTAAAKPSVAKSPDVPSRPRSKAWPQFVTSLAASLSALDEDQYLIIKRKDRPWFVQFAAQGSFGVRAELVSNSYLAPADQIAGESIDSALALGWQRPTGSPDSSTPEGDPDGSPNYFREWPQPVAFIDVARMAADTLVEVLAAPHPGTLIYNAFASDGAKILLPGLGLKPEPAETTGDSVPTSPPSATPSLDAAEVSRQLLEIVRAVSGDDELDVDSDGDIPLRYGSAMVFVRVFGDPPVIRVFSPVLAEARMGVDLAQVVNELNGQHLFVKWLISDGSVVASVDLFGDPLAGQHVLHACGVLGETVNELDEQLQEQFGGRTFFGEYAPPKILGHGGYL